MAKNKTQFDLRPLDIDKNIVDNIDNGIMVLNDVLSIHQYNKWMELHTNIKESSVLNKKLYEVFPSIKSETLIRKIKTALKMNSPTFYSASTSKYLIPIQMKQIKNSNFLYMQQDVSIIPFDIEKSLVALIISDQTNMANTNAILKTHIEQIKELNMELLKERNTIDKKILFIKFNEDGHIYDISEALLKLLKYEKDDLLNKKIFTFIKEHLEEIMYQELLAHMKDKKVYTFEQKALTSNLKELWFKSSLVPEYDSKGIHIGFILFRENITSSKLLEINREKILANSRSAAMGEMIGMIAHQWRQPLSLINTILITMKTKKELNQLNDKALDNYFKKIKTTTRYLSDTIDNFRDYFKPNKKASEINLLTLFDKSLFFLKGEMKQLKIKYILNIDEKITIISYKNELLQCIINIIKNSIDAFEESQKDKIILVNIESKEDVIIIYIEDNAGGIDKSIINKVYEPYFSTKSKNGTGLGLYMCQTIISKYLYGTLSITSINNTTKVQIQLPLKIGQIESKIFV